MPITITKNSIIGYNDPTQSEHFVDFEYLRTNHGIIGLISDQRLLEVLCDCLTNQKHSKIQFS